MQGMRNPPKTKPQGRSNVYASFRKLNSRRRRDVVLRILKDEKVLADLYDHLLIKQAMDEPGESVAWRRGRRRP
jgi:hypothetical protein